MHVGIYHPKAGNRHGSGVSVYVREMARHLADVADVTLYTERGDDTPLAANLADSDVSVTWDDALDADRRTARVAGRLLPLRDRDVPTVLAAADPLARGFCRHVERTVDALVTNYYLDDLLLSNRLSVPTVYVYHGVPTAGAGAWSRELCSRTGVTLANSPNTAREVRRSLCRRVDGVVTPGVDVDRFSPTADPQPVAADGGSGGGPPAVDVPVVLFVGRLVREKGVFDLLDAFADRSVDAELWFVGGRGDETGLRDRARERGIDERVRFLGTVPHDELHRYYAACDVFCSPSYYESFGMTNVEAMACGRAVITTELPGVRSYARDGENALLVEPGDVPALTGRLDELLRTPERRAQLGANGRAVAEQFAWHRQARALEYYCVVAIDRAGERIPAPSVRPTGQ